MWHRIKSDRHVPDWPGDRRLREPIPTERLESPPRTRFPLSRQSGKPRSPLLGRDRCQFVDQAVIHNGRCDPYGFLKHQKHSGRLDEASTTIAANR